MFALNGVSGSAFANSGVFSGVSTGDYAGTSGVGNVVSGSLAIRTTQSSSRRYSMDSTVSELRSGDRSYLV